MNVAAGEAPDLRMFCTAVLSGGQPAPLLAHRLSANLPRIKGMHSGTCLLEHAEKKAFRQDSS